MTPFVRNFVAGIFIAATWSCSDRAPPVQVMKHCVNETGLSSYYVGLDLTQRTGTVRYKYMGQDVIYKVSSLEIDGNLITGVAHFAGSATGEIRGNPMAFIYNHETETLIDGSVTAACANLQDPSLLELPIEQS